MTIVIAGKNNFSKFETYKMTGGVGMGILSVLVRSPLQQFLAYSRLLTLIFLKNTFFFRVNLPRLFVKRGKAIIESDSHNMES